MIVRNITIIKQLGRDLQPFYSQDLISNSPYSLPQNTHDINLEDLVVDQLLVP